MEKEQLSSVLSDLQFIRLVESALRRRSIDRFVYSDGEWVATKDGLSVKHGSDGRFSVRLVLGSSQHDDVLGCFDELTDAADVEVPSMYDFVMPG